MTELKLLRKCWCFSNSSNKPKQPRLVITGVGSGFASTQNQPTKQDLFSWQQKAEQSCWAAEQMSVVR